MAHYDLVVIGGGVIGLAHACTAARAGMRVALVERHPRADGASIRNFGFITVTGQEAGQSWRLARRTRDVWAELAPRAGIGVLQHGLALAFRSPEAQAVAEAFLKTEMGEGCRLLTAAEARALSPALASEAMLGALHSPHELRVESREAIPQLAAFAAERLGVEILANTAALGVEPGEPVRVTTSRAAIEAGAVVVCPGDDFSTLFPDRIAAYALQRCRLTMLRLADPGWRSPCAVMSDLGLTRYAGYAALPEARALDAKLRAELPEAFANGVHLIAVQSADGSLVVGDSHHYADLPGPFAPIAAEEEILAEYTRATGQAPTRVIERWTGFYASAADRTFLVDAPDPRVRLVIVTSGTGASTSFGIAETVLGDLFDRTFGDIA